MFVLYDMLWWCVSRNDVDDLFFRNDSNRCFSSLLAWDKTIYTLLNIKSEYFIVQRDTFIAFKVTRVKSWRAKMSSSYPILWSSSQRSGSRTHTCLLYEYNLWTGASIAKNHAHQMTSVNQFFLLLQWTHLVPFTTEENKSQRISFRSRFENLHYLNTWPMTISLFSTVYQIDTEFIFQSQWMKRSLCDIPINVLCCLTNGL